MSDITRFLTAQERSYETAKRELQQGRKQSHWIWYIFPQIAGLGRSTTAVYYSIADMAEAKEYVANPVLHERLLELCRILLNLPDSDPSRVMGWPDDMKLRSSMTLFREADPEHEEYQQVLDKFFGGVGDERPMELLGL